MANGDLFRALDQLAGVAGQEIEKARQFKLANAARLAEIARQQEQFNQTMELEKSKLDVMRGQLGVAIQKANTDAAQQTAKDRKAEIDARIKALDAQQKRRDVLVDDVANISGKINEAVVAGNQEQVDYLTGVLNERTRELNSTTPFAGVTGAEVPTSMAPEQMRSDLETQLSRAKGELAGEGLSPERQADLREQIAFGEQRLQRLDQRPSGQPQTSGGRLPTLSAPDAEAVGRRKKFNELKAIEDERIVRDATARRQKLEGALPLINSALDEWLSLDPPSSGKLGKGTAQMQAWARAIGASIVPGVFPGISAYKDTASSMAVLMARSLGDVGNIALAEREINQKLLPQVGDTYEQGLNKARLLKKILETSIDQETGKIKEVLSPYEVGVIKDTLAREGIKFGDVNDPSSWPKGYKPPETGAGSPTLDFITGQGGQQQGGTSTDSLRTDPDEYIKSLGY